MIASVGEILFDVFPEYRVMGGAPFNFIYHVNKLIDNGIFISRIGKDKLGDEVLSFLKNRSVSEAFLQTDDSHPTGVARVAVSVTGDPEFTIEENSAWDFIEKPAGIKSFLENNVRLLYFGTLAQRNFTSRDTIHYLWQSDVKCFYDVNIRQQYFNREILISSLRRADVVKLNYSELQLISELFYQQAAEIKTTPLRLMNQFDIEMLCVTKGSEGAFLFKGDKSNHHQSGVEFIQDTVGAGDAYSAVLAIGYLFGWDPGVISKLATEFAAATCTIKGALPESDDFYTALKQKIKGQQD